MQKRKNLYKNTKFNNIDNLITKNKYKALHLGDCLFYFSKIILLRKFHVSYTRLKVVSESNIFP